MNSYCSKCGAYENCTNPCIIGEGSLKAPILFIGEGIGYYEDKNNTPIYKKEQVNNVLSQIGPYYITNATKCMLTKTTKEKDEKGIVRERKVLRAPTGTEIDCCKAFTFKIINEMKPKVSVAMGSVVLKQLTGINMGMDVAHGKEFYHPYFDCYIIPTWDYDTLYKNDNLYKKQFNQDVKIALEKAKESPKRKPHKNLKTISTPVDIQEYLESLLTKEELVIDLETTGLDPKKDKITDIGLSTSPNEGVHIDWNNMLPHLDLLKKILESDIKVINHNIRFDAHFLFNIGITIKNMYFDTMLAYHTLTMSFEGSKTESLYKLKVMSYYMTTDGGHDSILDEFGGIAGFQNIQKGKKKKIDDTIQDSLFSNDDIIQKDDRVNSEQYKTEELDEHYNYVRKKQLEELKNLGFYYKDKDGKIIYLYKEYYTAMDANITFRIYRYLKMLIDEQYPFSFYEVTMPMNEVIFKIEQNGIMVDYDYMDKVLQENIEEMKKIEQTLFKEVKMEFNINSSKQVVDMMINKLKIKPDKKYSTPTGKPSSDDKAIKFYAQKKPVLNYILTYRELQKQNSNYLEGFKKLSDINTHRVHPSYLQHVTATSRLSCKNPSLHTTPKDNKIRNMIIPRPGWKLLVLDLSQIEIRILAMLANDIGMIAALESGFDFHSSTACKVFGILMEEFDRANPDHDSKRSYAKHINFGIAYLMGAKTLSGEIHTTEEEAQQFIDMWFDAFPNVKRFLDETKNFIFKNKYVETLYGRRRYLPYIDSTYKTINKITGEVYYKYREEAIRQGTNCVIQSPASDVLSMGLIKNQKMIDKYKMETKIVGTVHDSILFESPEKEVEIISVEGVRNMTENIPKITIKLKSDVQILDKWEK
jgi:uracil-DNA glycosylase family 4